MRDDREKGTPRPCVPAHWGRKPHDYNDGYNSEKLYAYISVIGNSSSERDEREQRRTSFQTVTAMGRHYKLGVDLVSGFERGLRCSVDSPQKKCSENTGRRGDKLLRLSSPGVFAYGARIAGKTAGAQRPWCMLCGRGRDGGGGALVLRGKAEKSAGSHCDYLWYTVHARSWYREL